MRAPGVRTSEVGDRSELRCRQAFQQRHPLTQRLFEVEFAAHRQLGDCRDLFATSGAFGQHLDDLTANQRRVDVHHDKPLGPSIETTALDGDVDLFACGCGIQGGSQEIRIGAGDIEFDAGDRMAGESFDAIDVRAGAGNAAGDRSHRRGSQRMSQHGDVQRSGTRGRFGIGPDRHLDLEPEVARDVRKSVAQSQFLVGARATEVDEHTEDQPAAQHDLLGVEDDKRETRKLGEQP